MPEAVLQTDSPLGDYRLLGLVGQGQFAQVYCGVHRKTGQLAAIKQVRHAPESASQEPFVLAELNRLDSHPNLVACQAIAQTPTGFQFILEYCEAGTLRSHLTHNTPLPFDTTKSLITDILKGLSHLHQQAIIHNDLKPENIFLTHTSNGALTAKIGDFGSARFAEFPNRSCQDIGSPTYAAPERFNGEPSHASDLYAVGIILYEMLLGDRPFSGTPQSLCQAHQTQPVPFPHALSSTIRQLLTTALHKEPEQRFKSAEAMLKAFQQIHELPLKARPALPTTDISQAIAPIPTESISQPINCLISTLKGCFITTNRSLHLLTKEQCLTPIAHFQEDVKIAVDPTGRWFASIDKQSKGGLYPLSRTEENKRSIAFSTKYVEQHPSEAVQIIALDSRYILQIQTYQTISITYLDAFTRRGQFIGRISLPHKITQATLSAAPYQLIAKTIDSKILLIALKPFQITYLSTNIKASYVGALPWGYVVGTQSDAVVFDRSGDAVSQLTGLPSVSAIAALNNHTLLIAAKSSPALFTANLIGLDIGIIF